ncbi:MAG: acyltransferase [Sphingobacteriales bacterium]|nr:acyltransferase [Sphingobacteriales bacterium]
MQKSNRINTLDGFRFIAILLVILYHFYSRWISHKKHISLYPYSTKYDFFLYGKLGVQFFFIISGFVIAYSLYSTPAIGQFWKKRIIRLFPPMLICSVITWLFCIFFDTKNLFWGSHRFINLLGSLTFIDPRILNKLFSHTVQFSYTSGAYWSIWPEIQFYCIASLIYYYKPAKFFQNFSIIAMLIYVIYRVIGNIAGRNVLAIDITPSTLALLHEWVNIFNISVYILWFLMGILFFKFYSGKYNTYTIIVFLLTLAGQFYSTAIWQAKAGMMIMICLFLLFIYFPAYLEWLNYSFITKTGLASYTLYLIHENIAIILINRYAGNWGRLDFLFPLLILAILIAFSIFSYTYIEKPASKYLKGKFL